jgi:DNA-binding transcriptional regulator GbsR (MarR family)
MPQKIKPKPRQKNQNPCPELEDVVNRIGDFIQYWGFKNVHGRIWAHLFLAGHPLDSHGLTSRLGISKALLSMSINELLDYDVIQTAGKTDSGSILYDTNPNLPEIIAGVLRKRERRLLNGLSSATESLFKLPEELNKGCSINRDRAEKLREFVITAESTLDSLLLFRDVSFENWTKLNCDFKKD